jgi:hypothetical protein
MSAPEPADLARQHGAHWGKQITEDEIMKIEQYDFGLSESEKPKPILAKVATFLPAIVAIVFAVMLVLL